MGKVVNNLDIISLVFILTGGIVLLYLSFSAGIGQYGMGLAFLAGAFVYLHLRKSSHRMKSLDTEMGDSKGENRHKTLLLLNFIFLLCFSASIYILHQALYIRPPIYFILVTAAYLSIFIEILYINKEGPACHLNILKTILLSLSFRAGRYFSFATIPGTDTQAHLAIANMISELGHIPGYEIMQDKYIYTPLWQVLVSATGILLDADSSKTLFFSIALPFVILISLFVFLIVKKIAANVQTGLIALLFVNIADMFLIRGLTAIYTSSLVLCFFFLILFCFMQEKNNTIFSAFILLSIFSMVITHQLSTFCVLIIFFSLLVSKQVYNFLLSRFELKDNEVKKLPLNINTTLFTFFLVFLVFYWSTMGEGGYTFFGGMVGRLKSSISRMFTEYTSACSYTNVFATYDIWSNLLYNLGYSILLGLAVVGLLLWLNHKYISLTRFAYIIAAVSLFAVIYVGTYVGLGHMFIPHRFLAFLEVFLVICAAYSVYVIYRSYTQPRGMIFVCFVVAALIFFMVTTPYINRNDAIYCNERVHRTGYTSSEVASAVWAVSHSSNEIIYTDPLFKMYKIPTVADISLSDKSIIRYPRGININAKNKRGLVIVRPYFERMGGTIFYTGTFGIGHVENTSQFLTTVTKNYDLAFSSGGTRVYYSGLDGVEVFI
jgi:hypothetical protein